MLSEVLESTHLLPDNIEGIGVASNLVVGVLHVQAVGECVHLTVFFRYNRADFVVLVLYVDTLEEVEVTTVAQGELLFVMQAILVNDGLQIFCG